MQKCALMVLLMMLYVGMVSAQEVSPELQNQLDTVELKTSAIRELDRLETTDLAFPTEAELEAYLGEQFDDEFASDEFDDDVLFYVGLDLMEPDIELETILFDYLLSQIAGFYDTERGSMNVILLSGEQPDENLPIFETITYSHEYVHALQDQHFDLEAFLGGIDESENGDFQLANLALMEGDATQVMTAYTEQLAQEDPLALAQAMLNSGVDLSSLSVPEGIPAIIEEELLFPYLKGQTFVAAVVSARGWDAINDAYANNPPRSTEHIYHPDTYLAGDMPIEVSIPDMSSVLDDNWRLAQDTSVGEFYLRQHLGTQDLQINISTMATGWGGDKINLYVDDSTGDIVWVWYQVWDTADDASEFIAGYTEFLNLRFGSSSGDSMCWSGDDAMCFTQIDDDETRISYAMTSEMALAILTYAD